MVYSKHEITYMDVFFYSRVRASNETLYKRISIYVHNNLIIKMSKFKKILKDNTEIRYLIKNVINLAYCPLDWTNDESFVFRVEKKAVSRCSFWWLQYK